MLVPLTIKVKIAKMGNSVRMTIPKPVLDALEWKDGDIVEVGIEEETMIVKRLIGKK